MKILLETYHSPYTGQRVGGAETSLRLIAEELAKRDHDVTFISSSERKTWLGLIRKNTNGVKVIVFTKFKFGPLNSYKGKSITNFFRDRFKRRLLSNTDIVHTYNNLGIVSYYTRLRHNFPFKLVVRMAGLKLFEDMEGNPKLVPIYARHFKKIDLFNFISEGLRDMVKQNTRAYKLDVDFSPCFTADIGIDLRQLPTKYAYSQKNPLRIVMASRLSNYQKRQDLLIQSLAYLKDLDVELTILGDGPNKQKLELLAQNEKVSDKVVFKPFDPSVWDYLINFDLMVHACDYEGLSKIIIESMGIGLPVLASNVLPLSNYIQDGHNGYLVDNHPQAWAEKIKTIYCERNKLEGVSENAQKFIEKNYASSSNVLFYESEFKALLNSAQNE